jgi:CheY-like chemotaxis protein
LIDDNPDLRMTLELLLSEDGYDVVSTDSGISGLDRIDEFQPEVAIIDIGLPGMDGYEVARAIRRKPIGAHIYLIALTGFGQHEDRKNAFEAGFNMHVTKPVELSKLERLLEQRPAFTGR